MVAKRSAEKREFWRAVLELHEASGLTVAAFCEQEGLKVPTFYAWRRKLLREAASSDARLKRPRSDWETPRGAASSAVAVGENASIPQFATIDVVDDTRSTMELEARGAVIRLREAADDNTVRRLLAILREA